MRGGLVDRRIGLRLERDEPAVRGLADVRGHVGVDELLDRAQRVGEPQEAERVRDLRARGTDAGDGVRDRRLRVAGSDRELLGIEAGPAERLGDRGIERRQVARGTTRSDRFVACGFWPKSSIARSLEPHDGVIAPRYRTSTRSVIGASRFFQSASFVTSPATPAVNPVATISASTEDKR